MSNLKLKKKGPDPLSELHLPVANLNRIMNAAVPADVKISKEARELITEATTEFIAFFTSDVCDGMKQRKRKRMLGEDLIKSFHDFNFIHYTPSLEYYN